MQLTVAEPDPEKEGEAGPSLGQICGADMVGVQVGISPLEMVLFYKFGKLPELVQ